jgi:drug/metabolite transporter (DMT)-like permease
MVIILALAAALFYGSADFLGGTAAKRARLVSVLVVTGVAGVVVQLPAALLAGGAPVPASIEWALLAGAIGGIGLMFFYAGLAAGPMSVVSPVAALVSTLLPVGIALAQGERPGLPVYLGGLLCVAATVLVSAGAPAPAPDHRQPLRTHSTGRLTVPFRWPGRGVLYGLASGAAFGLFFVFMKDAGAEGGALWPALASRAAGLVIYLAAALVTRSRPLGPNAGWRLLAVAAGAGALDAAANICYVLATRAGLFGLAVVLTSLYPGVTVLLARFAAGERMRRAQQIGLVLAAAGVVLVAA